MDPEGRSYPWIRRECAIYAEIGRFCAFRAVDARSPGRAAYLTRRLGQLPLMLGELMLSAAAGSGRLIYPVASVAPFRTCFAPGAPYAGTPCGVSSGRSRNSSRIPGAAIAAKAGARSAATSGMR